MEWPFLSVIPLFLTISQKKQSMSTNMEQLTIEIQEVLETNPAKLELLVTDNLFERGFKLGYNFAKSQQTQTDEPNCD
jgi:hypothetical protein